MGSIDVAKVITAAAASSLGVLSLLILAVAFIGYNFFKRSGERIKIGVFAVMLLAGTGFGVSVVREGRSAAEREPPQVDAASETRASVSPDPQPSVVAATKTDISGRWHDDDGYLFDVRSVGTALSYDAFTGGARVGSARGTFVGNRLAYAYVDDTNGDRGTCSGTLAEGGKRIAGTCTSGGRTWDFAIER